MGCVQVDPGAHAMAGQGADPTLSQEKPFGQSLLCAQVLAAHTVRGRSTAPAASAKARIPRNDRCNVMVRGSFWN